MLLRTGLTAGSYELSLGGDCTNKLKQNSMQMIYTQANCGFLG